jgi:hypothetical protein
MLCQGMSKGSSIDEIIAIYKRDIDRSLLRENLRRSPTARIGMLIQLQKAAEELRRAGRVAFR